MEKQINFEEITLRSEITSRGGGMEIDLTSLGFEGEKMSAYQNYLGGGLLGKVCSDNTIKGFNKPCTEEGLIKLAEIEEQLKRYFHHITNPDKDESPWESMNFERNQLMPERGY